MNVGALEEFLRELTGLEASSLGQGAVARAARRRMEAAGLADIETYIAQLRSDGELRQQLIEELVVPETWFFRDSEPFVLLAKIVRQKFGDGRLVRILSMPSSTGEEPYSIAITLFEAGLTAEEFRIDAVDISETALATARRASYGPNSFRGENAARRERWFHQKDGRYQPSEAVRSQVTFHHGNLFEFTKGVTYDFVFCRNVLIYFDAPTQALAVRRLLTLLKPEGVLFVGHAEAAVVLREGLFSWPAQRTFAFTRNKTELPAIFRPVAASVATAQKGVERSTLVAPRPFSDVVIRPLKPTPTALVTAAAPGSLEAARVLADQGKLSEAVRVIRTYLAEKGPTPQAFYLLGITLDAMGEKVEAEASYRKVLYLDPRHAEAIAHLALALEKRGDPGAAQLWQRAKRQSISHKEDNE